MILADISIKRPVLMTMVIMSFVVIGLFSYLKLGVDLMPKMDFPFLSVVTIYPGAGPEEIETLINEPLEEEISGIGGIKSLQSTSQEGMSLLFVELQLGEDVDIRAMDVRDKIDAIRTTLPDDIYDPIVQKFEAGASSIISLAVTGPYTVNELYTTVDNQIKTELSKISGVANVDILGEKEREIQVYLSIQKMREFEINPMLVVMALAQENLNLPAGRIEKGNKEYTLRLSGEFQSLEDIASTRIKTDFGEIRLDRIAQVRDDFIEQRELARFNDLPSIGIDLIKQSDANTVQVGLQVKRQLEKLKANLPDGVEIHIAKDFSVFIGDAVKDVFNNLVLGILFTALVLFLFLHSWRGTVIAAISMPISVVATFTLMVAFGFTLNMLSLMGLAVSVGILVVNAIVVLENIERLRKEGMDMKTAAAKGAGQIAVAVSAATLTNIVVFTPMAFMQGMVGPIFRQFGLTVAFATIFSLLISFTLTPMMASRKVKAGIYVIVGLITLGSVYQFVSQQATIIFVGIVVLIVIFEKVGLMRRFFVLWDNWYDELAKDYALGLNWALNHRAIVLSFVGILFVFGLYLFKFIGSEFFPTYDERLYAVSLEMPAGTSLNKTNSVLKTIEERIAQRPETHMMYTSVGKGSSGGMGGGGQGVQYGTIQVELKTLTDGFDVPTADVVKQLRSELADIPAAKIIINEVTQMGGGEQAADLNIQLQGSNMDDLVEASERAIEIVKSTGKAVDVRSDWVLGKPEIVVVPNRVKLADYGGTVSDVAMVLRTQFEGSIATGLREEGDEFDVRVRLMDEDRNNIEQIGDLLIPIMGKFIPLKEIAEINSGSGPTMIVRKNKQRMITISANVATGTTGGLQTAITQAFELPTIPPSQQIQDILSGVSSVAPRPSPKLPQGVTVYFGGDAEFMAETFSSLFQALLLAIILTYMLLAAILESYRFPLIIMLTLPLALIGVSMGLVIAGKTISMISLMAIIMLVGIVVNNGILLIDYTVELRSKGRKLKEAVLEACPVRLRPIIMSTMATVLGMLPLALGWGSAGEFRSPMAVVAIGGLIVSTVLTLFVIPTIYTIFEAKGEAKKLANRE